MFTFLSCHVFELPVVQKDVFECVSLTGCSSQPIHFQSSVEQESLIMNSKYVQLIRNRIMHDSELWEGLHSVANIFAIHFPCLPSQCWKV